MGLQSSDGQLVITNANGQVIWANGVAGGCFLRLTDEGRVQVVSGTGEVVFQRLDAIYRDMPLMSDGSCLGNTITSRNGLYRFVVQVDGNLVTYRLSDSAVMWVANWRDVRGISPLTNPGPAPYKLVLANMGGTFGDLKLTNANNQTIWSTSVFGDFTEMRLSNAGNLEILSSSGQVMFVRPFAIPDTPKLALQAKDLSGADNSAVAAWGPLIQANSAKCPKLSLMGGYKGKKCVTFQPSSQQFLHTPDTIPLPTFSCLSNGGYTLAALVKFKSTVTDWGRVFQAYQVGAPSVDFATMHKAGGILRTNVKWDGSQLVPANYHQESSDFAYNTWYVYTLRKTATSFELRRNNTVVASGTGTFTLNNSSVHLGLAANIFGGVPSAAASSQFGNIDIGAFLMYDRYLGSNEITNLYDYLNNGSAQ